MRKARYLLLGILILTALIPLFAKSVISSEGYCKKNNEGLEVNSADNANNAAVYPLRFVAGICFGSDGKMSDTCSDDGTHVVEYVCNKTTLKCEQYSATKGLYPTDDVTLDGKPARGLSCTYTVKDGTTIKGKCEVVDTVDTIGGKAARCCNPHTEDDLNYCDEQVRCCSGLICSNNKCVKENPDVTFIADPEIEFHNADAVNSKITTIISLKNINENTEGEFYCNKDSEGAKFTTHQTDKMYAAFSDGDKKITYKACEFKIGDVQVDNEGKYYVEPKIRINGREYSGRIDVKVNPELSLTVGSNYKNEKGEEFVQLGVPFTAIITPKYDMGGMVFTFSAPDANLKLLTPAEQTGVGAEKKEVKLVIESTEKDKLKLVAEHKEGNVIFKVESSEFYVAECKSNGSECNSDNDCCQYYTAKVNENDDRESCFFMPRCQEVTENDQTTKKCIYQTAQLTEGSECKPMGPCNPNIKEEDKLCSNGIDDDCDGKIDCRDEGCQNALKEPKWWPYTASKEKGEITSDQEFYFADCRRSFENGMPGCTIAECGLCINGKRCRCEMNGYVFGSDRYNWWNAPIEKSCTLVEDDMCKRADLNSECTSKGGVCINRSVLKGGSCTAEQGLYDLGVNCLDSTGKINCDLVCCKPERVEGTTSCGNENEACCPYGCNDGLSCCAVHSLVYYKQQGYYGTQPDYVCQKECQASTAPIQSITPNEDGTTTVYLTLRSGKRARLTLKNGRIVKAELDGDIWGDNSDYKEVALDNTAYKITNFGQDVYIFLGEYLKKLSVKLPAEAFPYSSCWQVGDADNIKDMYINECKSKDGCDWDSYNNFCYPLNKDVCQKVNDDYKNKEELAKRLKEKCEQYDSCKWNSDKLSCEEKQEINKNAMRGYGEECSQSVSAKAEDKCNYNFGLVCTLAPDGKARCQCRADYYYKEVGGIGACVAKNAEKNNYECSLNHPLGITTFEGKVILADTFNNRILILDNETLKKSRKNYYKNEGGEEKIVIVDEVRCSRHQCPGLCLDSPISLIGLKEKLCPKGTELVTNVYILPAKGGYLYRYYESDLLCNSLYPSISQISSPVGIAKSGSPDLYRIFITSTDSKSPGLYVYERGYGFFKYVKRVEGFQEPTGVFADENYVYVVDSEENKIIVLKNDNTLNKVSEFTIQGSKLIVGIAADKDYIYVTDAALGNGKVYKIKKDGAFVKDATVQGRPVGIAVNEKYVYVTDYDDNRILKYDKDLNLKEEVSNICPSG
ncbi:MAG: hypothetical protein QXW00_03500 [Candidatus Woesearchaeota archaeon]